MCAQDALSGASEATLPEVYANCLKQLQDLVVLIRSPLPDLTRNTLASLAVLDVHARDMTCKLVDANVTSVKQFEWLSQLRFYWSAQRSSMAEDRR